MKKPGEAGCDCCPPSTGAPPSREENPPGLDALSFRAGTHGTFKRTMLDGLADEPALSRLTTRADDDPAIALCDAWACSLDVLTFYQERIANEGYLRTSTERRSVLELARAIGYELSPGVAASVDLAFTVETAPGAPASVVVGAGTKVQSVPAQDQRPQIFETLAAIEARGAWNALPAVATRSITPLEHGRKTLYLRGQATRLSPGDALLIVGDERGGDPQSAQWDFRRVTRVLVLPPAEPTPDGQGGTTVVTLDAGLGGEAPHVDPAQLNARVYALRTRAGVFGSNAPDWRTMPGNVRATYLGLTEQSSASQIALRDGYPEWPRFTLANRGLAPAGAVGSGLLGDYYRGTYFDVPVGSRLDALIDFAASTPAQAWAHKGMFEGFSVRWQGWLRPSASGNFVLRTGTDDGVRLWIDGALAIDNWADHAETENLAPLVLMAGRDHEIRLEFYQRSGAATVHLAWKVPGAGDFAVIPTANLFPRAVAPLALDSAYPKIVAGSWALLAAPRLPPALYRVAKTGEAAFADYAVSGKATWLELTGANLAELFNERLRDTVIFGEPEELAWAPVPLGALLVGDQLTLAALEPDLAAGQRVVVTGLTPGPGASPAVVARLGQEELAALSFARDASSATLRFAADDHDVGLPLRAASELATVRGNQTVAGRTVLSLTQPLARGYLPQSLRINANVAHASHGDSRQMRVQPEVLGSGDGSAAFQGFTLKQAPLTFEAAATPSGGRSTLQINVAGVTWHNVDSLYGAAPQDRVFVKRLADDGTTTVRFGDGITGARLPTGAENVRAFYRVGLGAAGNLDPGQLSLLLTPRLGLKSVANPLPATGGADGQQLDAARGNAPLTVLTLDRIVSLSDFEDFAAGFAGVGKAQAVWLWNGAERVVHVTIANADGAPLAANAKLFINLEAAMSAARVPHQPVLLADGVIVRVPLRVRLRVDADRAFAAVAAAVRAALVTSFGFVARRFAQSLSASELVAVAQAVPGVDHVVFNWVGPSGGRADLHSDPLLARGARWEADGAHAAELLLLDPDGLELLEVTT